MKSGLTILTLFSFAFLGCYESPGEPEIGFDGIWIAEDYDRMIQWNTNVVVMLQFIDDEVILYFNQPNQAFQTNYVFNEDFFFLNSVAFPPDNVQNEYDFDDGSHLEMSGSLFGNRNKFTRTSFARLEEYKSQFLINEYGRWRGDDNGIFFELIRGGEGAYTRNGEFLGVSIVELDGIQYIRARDDDNEFQFWSYYLLRNELRVNLPDGLASFTRENFDNIRDLD